RARAATACAAYLESFDQPAAGRRSVCHVALPSVCRSRAHSGCAVAEKVQVVVHVPAAALSSVRLAPGTSRSSIMHPPVVDSVAMLVSFRYAGFVACLSRTWMSLLATATPRNSGDVDDMHTHY